MTSRIRVLCLLLTAVVATPAAAATVTVSQTNPTPGSTITVSVADGPGQPTDWLGMYRDCGDVDSLVDWKYLNGAQAPPPTGFTTATLSFSIPQEPGRYEFCLFSDGLFVSAYASQYEDDWICLARGQNGCFAELVRYEPVAFSAVGPDAELPPARRFTDGYVASYSVAYSGWSCTAAGPNGCRKDRVLLAPATYKPTAPDAPEPPSVQYATGYVAGYTVGPWSACSADCGPGTMTRTVVPNAWDDTAPNETVPASTATCNLEPCLMSCEDYDMYATKSACFGDGWRVCERRYRDDGAGGVLTCWKGF